MSYSPSLLGSGPVVSQPHPQSKAVLVEANGLFLTDMLAVGMQLQRTFRQGYTLDARNSGITSVRGSALSLEIETQNHYYTGNIGVAPAGAPSTAPVPNVPTYLPDTRSMFVGHHYSLAPLPTYQTTNYELSKKEHEHYQGERRGWRAFVQKYSKYFLF